MKNTKEPDYRTEKELWMLWNTAEYGNDIKTVFLVVFLVCLSWVISAYFYGTRGLIISIGITLTVMGIYLIFAGITNNLPT
jgi:hypothetical protein